MIIDGLHVNAPERIDLPNLKKMMEQRCYYRECYFLPTAHPRDWRHTYSLGNVAMATGTILFRLGQPQIQRSFPREAVTVHVAGPPDYLSISAAYDFIEIGLYSDE